MLTFGMKLLSSLQGANHHSCCSCSNCGLFTVTNPKLSVTNDVVTQLLMEAVSDALGIIFTESYISLAALLGMFLMTFGFASAGGVGASAAPPGSTAAKFTKDEDSISSRLALRSASIPLACPALPLPSPLLLFPPPHPKPLEPTVQSSWVTKHDRFCSYVFPKLHVMAVTMYLTHPPHPPPRPPSSLLLFLLYRSLLLHHGSWVGTCPPLPSMRLVMAIIVPIPTILISATSISVE